MPVRKLYAALIGINVYEKARNLNGCIKDILNADRFLRELCAGQGGSLEYDPLYFLAPHDSEKEKIAQTYYSPTFENVVNHAFDHLAKASEDDICLLYYSGHGSFITTAPEFAYTKSTLQTETLVLADSRSSARDLTDKELAYLLYRTLYKKPRVHCLVIMDCCHSGNNTRTIEAVENEYTHRQQSPSNDNLALEDYLGYKENYVITLGKKAVPLRSSRKK